MKKKIIIVIVTILLLIFLIASFLLTTRVRTDVYLKSFEVSSNGNTMVLNVGVTSSTGYVRKIKRTGGSLNGYYTFYSTYGINSKFGAKDEFEIEIDQNMDEIYFYTGDGGYKLVLVKERSIGEWEMVNYADDDKIKISLPDEEEIIKFGINTMSQDNNYTEYTDKDIINKIYNVLYGLETINPSITVNPEGNKDEIYDISFDTDEYEDKVEWIVSIYKKDGKCYVEQRYNGIYEIIEEDFNLIKSYVK